MFIRISLSMILASMLLFSLASDATTTSPPQYDLLIKNGRVIDGSGRAGFDADLAIKDDRIVRIGKLKGARATRVIDASSMVVAPGFIDMLGQSETFLLIDPRAMSKVMMGVTTEITGEGESIAPVNERLVKEQEDF
ncbi:MAG: D-aminoacylase, partial [Acidobacteriota bacterium]|nr:D-aminoacylase [Acidobacteriota bacterium]